MVDEQQQHPYSQGGGSNYRPARGEQWQHQSQGGVPPPGQKDSMAEIQEQITKFADSASSVASLRDVDLNISF